MAHYLLVAHQTAESEELLATARYLAREDSRAEFVLVVPATPVNGVLVWERDETFEAARLCAASARSRMEGHGLNVTDARAGDQDPVAAVADELRTGAQFEAIVVSTLAPGLSRWLRLDVLSRLRRNYPHHRVLHVAPQRGARPVNTANAVRSRMTRSRRRDISAT